MNALEMQSVSRSFGRVNALDGIDLTIAENSICGLLGRNGAGKTTIMSLLAGHDRPTSGGVRVFGASPFENEVTQSKLSFVRDNQRFPDNYRLHHVLRIAPEFAPNWSDEIAAELVDGLRIPSKTPIKKFSRGQLSSVAITIGLASRAPLTLLDEPYLGLDVTARALFHDVLLRDFTAHPRTVVLSTHLIEESESLFDRVVIVERGRIEVDVESEAIGALAFTANGLAEAVDDVTADCRILRSHTVAGLKSVTVAGPVNGGVAQRAGSRGVHLSPASLSEVVAAYGTDVPESFEIKKGVRA